MHVTCGPTHVEMKACSPLLVTAVFPGYVCSPCTLRANS